jgi:hypothetical protein
MKKNPTWKRMRCVFFLHTSNLCNQKRGHSSDFRRPRSNTDPTHTDHSHVSCSSYASDSQNTTHTITTKCVGYLHYVHNTILIIERISNSMDPFSQLLDFSGSTLLDLSDLLNVIAHLQSNLPDSLSPSLLLSSIYAAEKFYQLSTTKKLPTFNSSPAGFLQCLPPYIQKLTFLLNCTADSDHNSPPSHNISSIH